MDVKLWLESALADENLADFAFKETGTTEKGDGQLITIAFAEVEGKTKSGEPRTYNLALKYSKHSKATTERMLQSEIYFYTKIIPAFRAFREARGTDFNIFNSVPKYYGDFTVTVDQNEVLVLENMKKSGYKLHNISRPLSRNQLNQILEQYAELHAISAAFGDQNPEEFRTLITKGISSDDLETVREYMRCRTSFLKQNIDEVIHLLKYQLAEDGCNKWLDLKNRVQFLLSDVFRNEPCFKVMSHGDPSNNNFMFKQEPPGVVILDWRRWTFHSPVQDLSYLVYASISKEDLEDFDDILKHYHRIFSRCVRQLGSDPEGIYPFAQLLADWKKFSCCSLIYAPLFLELAAFGKERVTSLTSSSPVNHLRRDVGASFAAEMEVEQENMTEVFQSRLDIIGIKFKERMKVIIEHAVQRQFI